MPVGIDEERYVTWGLFMNRRKHGGFSLVELMVVFAIVGILSTIAIAKFEDYTSRAEDKGAQADATNLLTFAIASSTE